MLEALDGQAILELVDGSMGVVRRRWMEFDLENRLGVIDALRPGHCSWHQSENVMLVEFYLFFNLGLNPLICVGRFHRLRPIVGVWSEGMDEICHGGC